MDNMSIGVSIQQIRPHGNRFCVYYGGFPRLSAVLIIRIIVDWGLYWRPRCRETTKGFPFVGPHIFKVPTPPPFPPFARVKIPVYHYSCYTCLGFGALNPNSSGSLLETATFEQNTHSFRKGSLNPKPL